MKKFFNPLSYLFDGIYKALNGFATGWIELATLGAGALTGLGSYLGGAAQDTYVNPYDEAKASAYKEQAEYAPQIPPEIVWFTAKNPALARIMGLGYMAKTGEASPEARYMVGQPASAQSVGMQAAIRQQRLGRLTSLIPKIATAAILRGMMKPI